VIDPTRWEGEDKEEEVQESWEEEKAQTPSKPVNNKLTSKTKKVDNKKTKPSKNEPPSNLDPVAQKIKQQKLVEEADYENTKEMFAGLDEAVNTTTPKDDKDFEALAKILVDKFSYLEKINLHLYRTTFLKCLFRNITANMKSDEIKELATILTTQSNEKLKIEKEKTKKKKVPAKKTSLNVERDMEDDGLDDYSDFM